MSKRLVVSAPVLEGKDAAGVPDDKLKAVRAVYDILGGDRNESGDLVHAIPNRRFGKGKARILRKLVLVAIAKNAKADGSNSWPSLETVASRCLVTTRAVRNTINWLVKHRLLKVAFKAAPTSKFGRTNRYTILFPKPKKKASKHPEQSFPGAQESTRNNGEEHPEQWSIAPGNRTSAKRPSERPIIERPVETPLIPLKGGDTEIAPAPSEGKVLNLTQEEGFNLPVPQKKSGRRSNGSTDQRFQPIVNHYLKRLQEVVGVEGRLDGGDGKNLKALLRQHDSTPVGEITRWLDNAFDSTEQFPLKRGFRMTEFCRHFEKYVQGPLVKGRAAGRYAGSESPPVPRWDGPYMEKMARERDEANAKAGESQQSPLASPETDVAQLAAELYEIGGQTFPYPRLAPLLDRFTAAELSGAYPEFVANRDDFQMKQAVKEFCEGGAESIILAQRKRAEDARQMVLMQQRVQQEQAAESAKLAEAQKEEEEQAKKSQRELDRLLSGSSVECPATQ